MSSASDLQDRVVRSLQAPGALPLQLPVVPWRKKDRKSNLEVTLAAKTGLCIFVPMPVPTSALQGASVVFFDGYEVRVQIVEIPELNRDCATDLYDLIDDVANALHWQPKSVESPLAGILAHPLYIAQRPVETAEGVVAVPGFEHNGEVIRGADVIFNAVLQLNQ
jgi:hypothetical protein